MVRTDAVMIEKVHGAHDSCPWVNPGMRAPAHSTAAGRAILAFSRPSMVSSLASKPLIRTTPFSLASPQLLFEELSAIRQNGVAVCRDEVTLGGGAAAAPFFGASGEVVGALAISTKSSDVSTLDLRDAIKIQARALSAELRAT
jgi:DNA-binding IclR family transcriptional regulator